MIEILSPEGQRVLAAFAHDRTLVAFDFDGTLAPIVDRPAAAAMRPSTTRLLTEVARRYPVLIITGRARRDLSDRLGDAPVEVVGNHGAEPATSGVDVRTVIARARRALVPVVRRWPGVVIENKSYSLSLHYRHNRAGEQARAALEAAVQRVPGVVAVPGKFVLNVVARKAPDKSAAVEAVRRQHGCRRVIFVGDDYTDESVFRSARPSRLLGVRVGSVLNTRARYQLTHQRDVDRLLSALVRLRPTVREDASTLRHRRESALGPTLEFMKLLWGLDHALQKRSKLLASQFGVTGPQRLALRLIERMPEISAGHLAATLKVHPSTLTGVLQRLERRGMLTRRVDGSDRRRVHLALTSRGLAATRRSPLTVEDAVDRILRRTAQGDVETVAAVLQALVGQLETTVSGR